MTLPGVGLLPTQIYAQWQTGFLRNVYALSIMSFLLTGVVSLTARGLLYFISRRVARAPDVGRASTKDRHTDREPPSDG